MNAALAKEGNNLPDIAFPEKHIPPTVNQLFDAYLRFCISADCFAKHSRNAAISKADNILIQIAIVRHFHHPATLHRILPKIATAPVTMIPDEIKFTTLLFIHRMPETCFAVVPQCIGFSMSAPQIAH